MTAGVTIESVGLSTDSIHAETTSNDSDAHQHSDCCHQNSQLEEDHSRRSTDLSSEPSMGKNHESAETVSSAMNEERLCEICFEETQDLRISDCCSSRTCTLCLSRYIKSRISAGVAKPECPSCDKRLTERNIKDALQAEGEQDAIEEVDRIWKGDKRCPHCLSRVDSNFAGNTCPLCNAKWCFRCEATHDGIACEDFDSKSRMELKQWAKTKEAGQLNAQRCPKCRIYIQKRTGCDHMRCISCNTNFCYKCGGRFRHMKFFGDHFSKLSVFGCKYRYKPHNPVQRRAVRSAVFAGRVLALPVAGVGAVCGITALAVVAVPVYAGYIIHKNFSKMSRSQSTTTPASNKERPKSHLDQTDNPTENEDEHLSRKVTQGKPSKCTTKE